MNTDDSTPTIVDCGDKFFVESLYWMALCIYHESRGEPVAGQVAVGHTIMNRSVDRKMSVKEVVQQPKQFSWYGGGVSDCVKNHAAFIECMQSAMTARDEHMRGETFHGVDHYHHVNIDAYWNKDMTVIDTIGNHIFFKS